MALGVTWGGFADTDLKFSDFFSGDHTVAARFMLQFPNAYAGPMLSVDGTGAYFIGQGNFRDEAPKWQRKLKVLIGTAQLIVPRWMPGRGITSPSCDRARRRRFT